MLHWNLSCLARAFLAAPTELQYLPSELQYFHVLHVFIMIFMIFQWSIETLYKRKLIQAREERGKIKRMSMLVCYCNKNKRVLLSIILVFLCGINYFCGEKKDDQEGKSTKQISATRSSSPSRPSSSGYTSRDYNRKSFLYKQMHLRNANGIFTSDLYAYFQNFTTWQ